MQRQRKSKRTPRDIRVADFEVRAAQAPKRVYQHRIYGWRYIPVHHFAEEQEHAVSKVDCWCLLGEDVALLECATSTAISQPAGLWVRRDDEAPYYPKLHAIFDSPVITRAMTEAVMAQFVELGLSDSVLFQQVNPGNRIVLA